MGPVTDAGLIAGNIVNASSNNLTISGGTGSTFGTLTGSGGGIGAGNIGVITNTADGYVGSVTGSSVVDTDNANKTDLILTLSAASGGGGGGGGGGGSNTPVNNATDRNASAALGGLFNYTGNNPVLNQATAVSPPASSRMTWRYGARHSTDKRIKATAPEPAVIVPATTAR